MKLISELTGWTGAARYRPRCPGSGSWALTCHQQRMLSKAVVARAIRLACRLHGPAFDFRFRFGVSHFTSRAFLQKFKSARGYLEIVYRQNAYRLGL